MADKYLDESGLSYFWTKLKAYFQQKLISGTNIKTINSQSILGSGDMVIGGGGSVLDFYPVGSFYETSDSAFDPNVTWGGTWELESAGTFHMSAGSGYAIGSSGGSANAVVVSHSHQPSTTTENFVTNSESSANNTRVAFSSSGNRLVDGLTSTGTSSFHHRNQTSAVGQSGAGKNLPPYVAVNRWHRTA